MLNALKTFIADLSGNESARTREPEQRQLQVAVAGLLHEMTRVDLKERTGEMDAAARALQAMFGLSADDANALLRNHAAQRFTSYFGPVSVIKRLLSMEQRVALVEHLWRVAFSDDELDVYEDHFVRKIAHLLYVSNTEAMLARQRAKRG